MSAVTSWSRRTLDDRAAALEGLSSAYRQSMRNAERTADGILGDGWGGDASTAAAARVEKELLLARTIADAIDDLVAALRRHAGTIQGVRDNALAKVAAASVEFNVSDDWQVDHSGPPENRQEHVDAITGALTELAEVDREVAFDLDGCFDEIASCVRDSVDGDDYVPPATLAGLSAEDVARLIDDPDFARWVDDHPDAAKPLLDAAVDAHTLAPDSDFYKTFLRDFWQGEALQRAGIDLSQWDPTLGTEANAETINKVYEYYGQLFLDHPSLQWAGMANMIGPSFAGGFYDLDMMRDFAGRVGDIDLPAWTGLGSFEENLDTLANLTDDELAFYETTLLSMQREIFLDQGAMHEAYLLGGSQEIQRMLGAELIDKPTRDAWQTIERGDAENNPQLLADGNMQLLHREQWDIIADDYDRMRNHPVTGGAVTWGITTIGTPSIPGAQSYPEAFPKTIVDDVPLPYPLGNVPLLPDSIDIVSPFPEGNISNADQRWNLIVADTLPAYQRLLTEDLDRAREIVASDFQTRLESQRIGNTIDDVLARIESGWSLEGGN